MENKKTRGRDKKPRKKYEGPATPLQRAQRDRQSKLFVMQGAMGSIMTVTYDLTASGNKRHLFLPEELVAIKELREAIRKWYIVANDENRWEKVKQNLAASVENSPEKV